MPEIITCPDCGRKLRVPDELIGKPVKCPDCNVKFTGGITTAPTSPKPSKPKVEDQRIASSAGAKKAARSKADDEEEADEQPARQPRDEDDEDNARPTKKRRRRRRSYDDDGDSGGSAEERRRGWELTLWGLNMLVFSTYAYIATVVIGLFGCMIAFLFGARGVSTMDPETMMGAGIVAVLLYGVILLGYFITGALQTTGHGFCMAIPNKIGTGRKVLAIATFCCALAAIVLYLGGCGLGFVAPRAREAGLVSLLPWLGWYVCYFLFLRSVAVAMREDSLAQQAVYLLVAVPALFAVGLVAMCIVLLIVGMGVAGAASSKSPDAAIGTMGAGGVLGLVCGLLLCLVWLGLIAWYIVLVHQIRNAVRDYLN